MEKGNRTIRYFYDLDEEKRETMLQRLVTGGRVSVSAAYNYLKGERRPMFLYRDMIRKLVKEIYQESVPDSELFPKN